MKSSLIVFVSFLLSFQALGQTESEYYRNPVDTFLKSKFFATDRKITIILPKSYNPEKPTKFPLIIVFDRQNSRIFRQIFETINYLVSFDEVPESIIIGISSENNQRFPETSLKASSTNAKGAELEQFLFEELIPWAEQNYNCSKVKTLIGHSRFGYFSSYLLAKRMNELSAVISCSPFYLQDNVNLVDTLQKNLASTKLQHHVYYRFITGDSVSDSKDYRIMYSFLEQSTPNPKFKWKGSAFYNVQHMAVPGVAISSALIEVFDYWSGAVNKIQQSNEPLTAKGYQEFKKNMQAHYGDTIGLGIAVFNGLGYKYYNEQKFNEARIVWTLLLEEYPMFTYAYVSIAKSYMKQNNKVETHRYLEIAQQHLTNNNFYSAREREEMQLEIERIK